MSLETTKHLRSAKPSSANKLKQENLTLKNLEVKSRYCHLIRR